MGRGYKQMELEFTQVKQGQFSATGTAGKFLLMLNPLEKVWNCKLDGKVIGNKIKGYGNATAYAQNVENEEEELNTMATVKTNKTATTKVSAAKVSEVPAAKKAIPAAKAPAKKVTPASATQDTRPVMPPKKRGETDADYKNRTFGVKMQIAKWDKANGEVPAAKKAIPAAKAPAKKAIPAAKAPAKKVTPAAKVKLSPEERYGPRWNDFGDVPSPMNYAIAQLTNARASVAYGVVHGAYHPHSPIARDSYLNAVKRALNAEQRVYTLMQEGNTLPKGFKFQYFNAKGLDTTLVGGAPEGYSAFENASGSKVYPFMVDGQKVTLPINPNARKR